MFLNVLKSRWLIATLIAMVAFQQASISFGQSGKYTNISFEEFSRWLDNKDFLLVNVHVPYQGEIPGTDMLLPYYSVKQERDRLPAAKDAKIILYCLTGPMGHSAAKSLAQLGYTRVYHYAGGMLDWVRNGRQLIDRNDR